MEFVGKLGGSQFSAIFCENSTANKQTSNSVIHIILLLTMYPLICLFLTHKYEIYSSTLFPSIPSLSSRASFI